MEVDLSALQDLPGCRNAAVTVLAPRQPWTAQKQTYKQPPSSPPLSLFALLCPLTCVLNLVPLQNGVSRSIRLNHLEIPRYCLVPVAAYTTMAEEFSSLLNETQCKLGILVRSMMEKVDKERERANRPGRQRDELLLGQSQAEERETDLTRQVSEQKERLRVLEQLVADERARAKCSNDKHNRKSFKAHNKIKALMKKIESMEEASAVAIPQEWHKAQLLRKQSDTITKSQIEIDDLRENLRVADVQVSQQETQVKELKQELEYARKSYQEVEVVSQQRLEELRDRFEAEHHSLRCELDEGQRKMQAKEQQLERLKGRSQSQKEEHQKKNALFKAEICDLQNTVNEMSHDLRQKAIRNRNVFFNTGKKRGQDLGTLTVDRIVEGRKRDGAARDEGSAFCCANRRGHIERETRDRYS
jgi:hypothetical protein